jgi:nucleoside-diphosphate-sugar epimerase
MLTNYSVERDKILVIGANGQLGSVLSVALQKSFGEENVILSDIKPNPFFESHFKQIDAMDFNQIEDVVKKYSITQIYHLAAILSAAGETYPLRTWELNMKMMLNVFEVARKHQVSKVFFPSSIAVFGSSVARSKASQSSTLNPATVYGISKAAGENWVQYYFDQYGLDIRSLRYPGIIGYESMPGGGTTDYAVEIYHSAVKKEKYICCLNPDIKLPLIYMDDAIHATIEIMQTPKENIRIRTSYNLASMSLSPIEIATEIQKLYPSFKVEYRTDHRQAIAAKWPSEIDDQQARKDWNWQSKYDLNQMTKLMLEQLEKKYKRTNYN